ncbi:hypothetical protein F511_30806 [Dorcoceras hygrometricum]|uniref:Splicing factor 3B subunit 1-like n=1 Tax=Dorcoceras hygrometricum TaxID=472368 RepID=A0A2Z7BH30_9LAMI|nr:hypothetical protein F511_30806 [Dorcoceras hygrometricum]
MAASLIQNALQVNFDSVLSFLDEGMVQMFKALELTVLRSFLGFPSVLYEDYLVDFFAHSLVRENAVISCVHGKFVEISEERFVGVFDLPTAGLTSMDEVPKDLIYDARSVFFASGEPLKTSCKNKEMKIEFRLLNDILAKSVTVKAGSFDAVTHERFLLMKSIHCGLKINWSKIFFDILKDMVTPSSKQANGFAAQICILLKGAPDLTLGEAKTFPPLKILTIKTVGTYVAKNKSITAEEATDEMPVEKVVKKEAAKRSPAPAAEPVAKRKRTTVWRAAPTEMNLAIVPVMSRRLLRKGLIRREQLWKADVEETVEEIVAKVLTETADIEMEVMETVETVVGETAAQQRVEVEIDKEEPAGMDTVETDSRINVSAITSYDVVTSFKVLSNEEGTLVEKEKETEKEAIVKGKRVEKIIDSEDTEPLSKVLKLTEPSTSDEESVSIDDILRQISEDMMLPSVTVVEPTKIKFGHGIAFREVNWYNASLPKIDDADKGKEPLVEE